MTWMRTRRSRGEARVPARGVGIMADPPSPPRPSAAEAVDTRRRYAAVCASAMAGAYLVPVALAAALAGLVTGSGAGPFTTKGANRALAGGILLVGIAAGTWAGGAAAAVERRALTQAFEQRLDDLDHDIRGPLTIIQGEIELVLSREDLPSA